LKNPNSSLLPQKGKIPWFSAILPCIKAVDPSFSMRNLQLFPEKISKHRYYSIHEIQRLVVE